jgi:hypothetical protein
MCSLHTRLHAVYHARLRTPSSKGCLQCNQPAIADSIRFVLITTFPIQLCYGYGSTSEPRGGQHMFFVQHGMRVPKSKIRVSCVYILNKPLNKPLFRRLFSCCTNHSLEMLPLDQASGSRMHLLSLWSRLDSSSHVSNVMLGIRRSTVGGVGRGFCFLMLTQSCFGTTFEISPWPMLINDLGFPSAGSGNRCKQ